MHTANSWKANIGLIFLTQNIVQNENGFRSEFNPNSMELPGTGYKRELEKSLTYF